MRILPGNPTKNRYLPGDPLKMLVWASFKQQLGGLCYENLATLGAVYGADANIVSCLCDINIII